MKKKTKVDQIMIQEDHAVVDKVNLDTWKVQLKKRTRTRRIKGQ